MKEKEERKMKVKWLVTILCAFVLSLGWSLAWAKDDVIITPLGSNTGNSCGGDRAILLEDPNGTRILYDPGRTVAGGDDTRLKDIDGMILSSVHSDHIGDKALNVTPKKKSSECGTGDQSMSAKPQSNFAEIMVAKDPKVRVGGEMRDFLRRKARNLDPGHVNNLTDTLRHGGTANIGGVLVSVIAAHHSNGIPLSLVDPSLRDVLDPDDLVPYVGPENGYVLTFTNGLTVYLSGDTGHTSDMKFIVRDFYDAKVAILNCGDKFSMGPVECAFAVNKLIQPETAIPSHIRETATKKGKVVKGTKTQTFIDEVDGANVIVPLSGVEIKCNKDGNCKQGK